ncbi:MAG TPA: tail fiber domain-containing protein, partial [Tissierellaceae bacterium]|nr:tail fiber domain-containing protein [Tissierellaceae bacterium]
GKENSFTKNNAFNKTFGTGYENVPRGNDSRINNGQTAYGWGNHASAGYIKSYVDTTYTAGNGISISGANVITNTYPNLSNVGNYSDYARKTQNEIITGDWMFRKNDTANLKVVYGSHAIAKGREASITIGRAAESYSKWSIKAVSDVAWGNYPDFKIVEHHIYSGDIDRLVLNDGGLTTGNITAQKGAFSSLDVSGISTFRDSVNVNSKSNGYAAIQLKDTAGNDAGGYQFENSTQTTLFRNYKTGGFRFQLPNYANNTNLDTDGNWIMRGNVTATGEVTAYSSSDVRLKQNIKPIENALDIISKLNPVTFNWNSKAIELNKNKDSDRINYGVIAQEMEKVLPELVHQTNNYKSVDYPQLIMILAKGIQELRLEMEELKNK